MSEENNIGVRALKWLQREQKRAQHAQWTAFMKNASEQDMANIQNKLDVLDWLIDKVAIGDGEE